MGEFQKSLNHLFGCLEEIQFLVDERESKQSSHEVTWEETEEMLDEIKFNIVIVSLMKSVLCMLVRTTRRLSISSRSSSPRPRARNSRNRSTRS